MEVLYLPGCQEEHTAHSQVGQEHEEPDRGGEGIQEGEVSWFPALEASIENRG